MNWRSKLTISESVIFLAVVCCFVSRIKTADLDAAEVTRVVEAAHKCYNIPGLAVSVVKDGQTILSQGFGVRNLEGEEPVNADTVFGIASVSKSFAATLLVKLLYEETNFTVDSKVQALLGDKFKLMDEFRTKEATFADLMAHRMAIPANNRLRFDTNLTRDTIIERLALLTAPGQFRVEHIYSNLVYGLITHLAEVIGEDTWENLLSRHLLVPLGMDRTTFATTADFKNLSNMATGYLEFQDELAPVPTEFNRKWGLLAGSGAVMTTVNDMVKWMNFHLLQGRGVQGQQIMAPEHIREVHKGRMLTGLTKSVELRQPEFPVAASQTIYAHGLRRGVYRGYERLTHSGSTLGYKSLMSMLPAVQVGVFTVLSGEDRSYRLRSALHYYLMDWALGLSDPWLNATTICSFPEPWRQRAPKPKTPVMDTSLKPALNVSLFEGTYQNKAYGYLHVGYNTSLHTLVLDYGWGRWQLFYQPPESNSIHTSTDSSTASTHTFFGKGIDITAIDLYYIDFVENALDGEDKVVDIKATAFEGKVPPVFSKLGSKKIVSNDGPAHLGFRSFMLFFIIFLALQLSNVS